MSAAALLIHRLTLRLLAYFSFGLSLLFVLASSAFAAEINITARFLPDSSNPNINKFENTTPNGFFCQVHPSLCPPGGTFSIEIPNQTRYTPLVINQGISLRAPHSWREIQVRHTDGSTQMVKFRVIGMSAKYDLSATIQQIAGPSAWFQDLWFGGESAPPGCSGAISAGGAVDARNFFWRFDSDSPCIKEPRFNVTPGIWFNHIGLMYELQTPNPLKMSMGTYRGSVTYTFGPTGDIQFGPGAPTDPTLTVNFTLSVQHTLNLRIPTAANALALEPQGGWQQWLYNGTSQLPQKLLANQTFQLWSSTKFKIQLQCQYPVGSNCGIKGDIGNKQIAVKTMVTLPYGMQSSNTQVSRLLLSNSTPSIFDPIRYVNDERATLHFEVDKQGVEQMILNGGGRYRGDVTIIWDSQI